MSFSAGFAKGVLIGDTLAQNIIDNRARQRLEELDTMDVVELGAPEPPEAGSALAEGQPKTAKEYATRYQFGDKVYSSKPPQYEIEYQREQQRAKYLRDMGDTSLAENVLSNAKTRYGVGAQEHYDSVARRAQTLFYDDLGMPLPVEQILSDETRRAQATELLNDYAFEDLRGANGNLIRVEGFTPTGDGRFAADLVVADPKSGEVISRGPATQRRSSDADDAVVLFSPETAFPQMLDYLRGKSATFADSDNTSRAYRGKRGLVEAVLTDEGEVVAAQPYAPAPSTSAPAQPQGLGGEQPGAPDVAENPSDLDFSVLGSAPASAEPAPRPAAAVETVVPAERTPSTGLEAATRTPSVAPDEAQERTPSTSSRGGRERTPSTGVVGERPTITSLLGSAGRAISGAVDRVAGWADSIENGEPAPSTQPQAPTPSTQPQVPASTPTPAPSPRTETAAPAIAPVPASRQAQAQLVMQTAEQHGVDPSLALRVAQIESNLNPKAVSPKGAQSLMQVMPATARDPGFGIQPARNSSVEELTRVGVQYFGKMLERYDGDVTRALVAYNAGPGVADNLRSLEEAPAETRAYVKRFYSGQGTEPRGLGSAPRAPSVSAPSTYATTARRPTQRGLDAAITLATRFPNEMKLEDAERYRETGRLADTQFVSDKKGNAAAVDPYTGSVLWERAAPQTPVSQAEQIETNLKLEKLRHETAQARMKTIETVGKQAFGDDFTPEVGTLMAVTLDARGINPTQENLSAVMHHAKRTTEAVQEKMDPIIGSGPVFRSYSVGMAAGALGLTATDAGEVVDRLVKPMQSIVSGKSVSEEVQLQLMIGLGTVQERAGVTPAESAQLIQTAMRYGFRVSDLLQHIEQAKEEGVQLTPSRYEQVLAQQTGRHHAE